MSEANLRVMNKLAARAGACDEQERGSELGALLAFSRPKPDERIKNKIIRNIHPESFNLSRI